MSVGCCGLNSCRLRTDALKTFSTNNITRHVLLRNVNIETLNKTMEKKVNRRFMDDATSKEAEKRLKMADAFLYGSHRIILPAVLRSPTQAKWLFWLVDTGYPATLVSDQVCASPTEPMTCS